MLWAKANKSGAYTLDVARNSRFTRGLHANVVRARKSARQHAAGARQAA